ncbi:MAG: hypothetical protein MPJ22_08820, partial [Pirellulales bacterium]|nr:hypothetical protein [Pirellulales bacterium]
FVYGLVLSPTCNQKQLSLFEMSFSDPKLVHRISVGLSTSRRINFTSSWARRNTMFLLAVDNKIVRFPFHEIHQKSSR